MRKILLSILVWVVWIQNSYAYNTNLTTGCSENLSYCPPGCGVARTFILTRPVYRNIAAQWSLWHDVVFNACQPQTFGFQILPIFQRTLGSGKVTRYFLFDDVLPCTYNDNSDFLVVKGDDADNGNQYSRDIRAEWINLPSTFAGSFTVRPKQEEAAVWLEAYYSLRDTFESPVLKSCWLSVALPIHYMKTDINLTEYPSQPTVTPRPIAPTSIAEALSNPAWNFAKFGPSKKEFDVAELNLKIGSNFLDQDGFQLCIYSSAVAPLHGYNNPGFVFSPVLGTNRHFGYGTGLILQLPMTNDYNSCFMAFFFEIENIYFFRDSQKRTFDLKLKPWSRYLLLVNEDGRTNIPAVNILTRGARIRPFNMVDMTTGVRYQSGGLEMELGLDVWARGREDVKLKECFPCGYGIQGVGFLSGTNIPATANTSTIGVLAPNDVIPFTTTEIFVPITENDIELTSAAARGAINFRLHLAGGYSASCNDALFFIGFGGFFEVPNYNTDFKRYGAWGKIGFGF